MLRNIGIRSKILAVLALPVLVLLLAATVISVGAVNDARRAAQVEALSGQAAGLTQLVRGLQAERALTGQVLAGDESARPMLEEVRAKVSAGIDQVRGGVGQVDVQLLSGAAAAAVADSAAAHDDVDVIRRQVDTAGLSATTAFQRYSDVIAADVALPSRIADAVDDQGLAGHLRAYTAAERLAELVTVERDLITPAVAAGFLPRDLRDRVADVVARQEVVRDEVAQQTRALGIRLPATSYSLQLARNKTIADADGVLEGIDVESWRAAADTEVAALSSAETALATYAAERSAQLASDARAQALQVALVTAALVIVPVLLALVIAGGITRPLRRLTEAASEVRDELPTMVEQMQTPGEAPELSLPQIPVTSEDEVGRLAAAFNEVNATTVQVAQEQAALRGSIAAMFVNVARRDQVLLSRQLAFIDQLERTEENPKTLKNLFKLDHLATRMRRNAESLLVLAGIDTGRRLRRPMPLSDVVRTATSEIEHYERVDLVLQTDPPMVGHVALTAAHLLAELLENATNFSDPDTRVVVSTSPGPQGVVVTITDDGLGMSAQEIADANARIAEPPVTEVVGAQRLGFFVVGRLARRLDAVVTLRAGRTKGTTVRIELPPALFVPGAVVELPAADTDEPVSSDARAAGDAASTGELPVVDLTGPVAAPAGDADPASDGLPRRGGTPRVTPPVPVDRAPSAAAPAVPVPAAAAAPAVAPEAAPTGPDGLPRRRRSADPAPAAEAAAPVAAPPATPVPDADTDTAPRRGGLFSSFRSRKPGDEPLTEALAQPDEAPYVPEAEAPAAELTVARVVPSPAEPADEPAPVLDTAPVVGSAPVVEVEPVLVTEPVVEPEFVPEPDAPAGVTGEIRRIDVPLPVVEVAPVDEVEPDADIEPDAVTEPDAEVVPATPVAATDLFRSEVVAPAAAARPAPAPQPAPEPEPAPAHAAAALNILPSRSTLRKASKQKSRRGLFGRKQDGAGVQPVQPMSRRELHELESGAAEPFVPRSAPVAPPAPVAGPAPATAPATAFPAPSGATPPVGPFGSAPSGVTPSGSPETGSPSDAGATPLDVPAPDAPAFGSPQPRPEPVMAPSSLFTAIPAQVGAGSPVQPAAGESGTRTGSSPLPARGSVAPAVRTPEPPAPATSSPAPVPAPEPVAAPEPVPALAGSDGMADVLRQRSALASEALTELSRLSAYSPAAVDSAAPASLARRTPASTPAAQVAPARPASAGPRRSRNAADVRSMLSGFQAGVTRGRTSPSDSDSSTPDLGQPDTTTPTGGHA